MPEIKVEADKTLAQSLLTQGIATAATHSVSLHRCFPSSQAFLVFAQKLPSHQACHSHEAIRDPNPKHPYTSLQLPIQRPNGKISILVLISFPLFFFLIYQFSIF